MLTSRSSRLTLIATCGITAALAGGVAFALPADDAKPGAADSHMHATVGKPAPAFTLKDTAGKEVKLADFAGKVVVLEWINPGCPVCKGKFEDGSVTKMIEASKAIDPDVVFLFINSTAATADRPQESADYMKANKVVGTGLIDGDGAVGHMYGAKTTPHCYVIDAKGVLAYNGAIDDKGSTNYVVDAVKALKEGKAVSPATTKPYGCSVKYGKSKKG